jgi:hypothetical protein
MSVLVNSYEKVASHMPSITTHLPCLFTCFDIYSMVFMGVYFYVTNSTLASVVVHAFEHFRCFEMFVENRLMHKYILHYKCGYTYF